ncbi:MAG: double zinc ribbon domain-containing protein [Shewanella sp.]|nr:double zinc ribbon domain-containing protein [Shewanella sp.]MCF1430281.1 double zinc ribbon domain-containing protein [Shewanella sp.]MCF1438999.1 double zinc ribbon domain-containing protein [Shewanella sp.]MCF1458448.1 double zinc ribbon domain-containing protein [Shewanella sp.]
MINRIFKQWVKLMGASLPNRCLLCHQSIHSAQTGLCGDCLQQGLYRQPICLGCGRGMTLQSRYCGGCQQTEPLPVIAPASYHQGLGGVVADIKYRGELAPLQVLCEMLVNRIEALEALNIISRPQALLPVPLHPSRLRQRGFNQAYVIAETLSAALNIPVLDGILVRTLATKAQAGLDGKARRRNLKGAFMLMQPVPFTRIAIVDDVVTTASTVEEMARLLRWQAPDLQVWCLARAQAPGLLD